MVQDNYLFASHLIQKTCIFNEADPIQRIPFTAQFHHFTQR